jgi:hypothetical protein
LTTHFSKKKSKEKEPMPKKFFQKKIQRKRTDAKDFFLWKGQGM